MKGKVVLVTGASCDIGKFLCKRLIEMQAIVIGLYNNNSINDDLFITYKVDITDEVEVNHLFARIKDKYKKIDIVINLAALSKDADIYDKTKEDFMRVLEVNIFGTFQICREAAKLMDKGIIINMASTNATTTYTPISIDYDASKAGIINLTKNLSLRFPNLKICALAPNYIETKSVLEMNPNYLKEELYRIGQTKLIKKEEVVNKIIDICISNDTKSGDIIFMEDSNE